MLNETQMAIRAFARDMICPNAVSYEAPGG